MFVTGFYVGILDSTGNPFKLNEFQNSHWKKFNITESEKFYWSC